MRLTPYKSKKRERKPVTTLVAELAPGSVFRGFYIVRLIAEGGMGIVFEASNGMHPGKRLALKVMKLEFCGNVEARGLFKREARLCNKVSNHPNGVKYYGARVDGEDRPFLVMELLEGVTLEQFIQDNSHLTFEQRLLIARQVARIISHTHNQDCVHRDLKPENIFLVKGREGERDWVRLLDFGIGKSLKRPGTVLTRVGGIRGTPNYMAPEQFEGQSDQRSDVFCLGLVIYFIFRGEHAMKEHDLYKALSERHALMYKPLNVGGINDEHVANIVSRACRFEPSKRYEQGCDVVLALETSNKDRPSVESGLRALVDTQPFAGKPVAVTAFDILAEGAQPNEDDDEEAPVGAAVPNDPPAQIGNTVSMSGTGTEPMAQAQAAVHRVPSDPFDRLAQRQNDWREEPIRPSKGRFVVLSLIVAVTLGIFLSNRGEPRRPQPTSVLPTNIVDAGGIPTDAGGADDRPTTTQDAGTRRSSRRPRDPHPCVWIEDDNSIVGCREEDWDDLSDRERDRTCHWLARYRRNDPLTRRWCIITPAQQRPVDTSPSTAPGGFPSDPGGLGQWGGR